MVHRVPATLDVDPCEINAEWFRDCRDLIGRARQAANARIERRQILRQHVGRIARRIDRHEEDEFVFSAGLDVELGGTGSKRLGVERFNTYTRARFFGKGLGALPKSADLLRPLAVTGFAGIAIPGRSESLGERNISHIVYGAAIEYSLPYLHANVRDIGLPDLLNQVTPLVEFSLSTPVDGEGGERTTGTINPGLI